MSEPKHHTCGTPVNDRNAERDDDEGAPPEVMTTLLQNQQAFLSFLERRVGRRELAEDILHDALVRSIDKVGALREPDAIVAWFYRVLRNAVIDHQRRNASASKALSDYATELETEQFGTDTRGAICGCVSSASTLKPEYAEALRRIEVDGIAVKAYADETGITSNNAGVRVFRARDALRKQVQRSCGACASRGCVDCTCSST